MINTLYSKNKVWEVGSIVNIGFIKGLKVIGINQVKDGLPDIYTLESVKGVKYEFIPHNGLTRI